jgi:hypothetical protein
MNNRKQPSYKKYETALDRKARVAEQMERRNSREKSYINNQFASLEEDDEYDYDDDYEVTYNNR